MISGARCIDASSARTVAVGCLALMLGVVVTLRAAPCFAAAPAHMSRQPEVPPAHRVDIDTAGVAELALLPEIGPVLAAQIVGHRATHGAFGAVDALERVPCIGPATIRALGRVARASSSEKSSESGIERSSERSRPAEHGAAKGRIPTSP